MSSPFAGGFSDNFSCEDKGIEVPFLPSEFPVFLDFPICFFRGPNIKNRGLGEEHQAGAGHRLGDLVIETELDIEFGTLLPAVSAAQIGHSQGGSLACFRFGPQDLQ